MFINDIQYTKYTTVCHIQINNDIQYTKYTTVGHIQINNVYK